MNLSEITNVNDLIEANGTTPDVDNTLADKILDLIDNDPDVTPTQILVIAQNLVAQVGAYHDRVVKTLADDPESVEVRDVWVRDEQKLHTAWNLLQEVSTNE